MKIVSTIFDDHTNEQTRKNSNVINVESCVHTLTESEQAQTISLGFIGLMSIEVIPHLLRISISSLQ